MSFWDGRRVVGYSAGQTRTHDISFSFPDIGGEFTVVPTLLLYTDKKAAQTSGALTKDDVTPVAAKQTKVTDIQGGVNATVTVHRNDVTAGYVDTSAGRIFTRDQLLTRIWGYDYAGDGRTVDVHVSWLRSKLRAVGGHNYFRTVRGVGYAFAPPGAE